MQRRIVAWSMFLIAASGVALWFLVRQATPPRGGLHVTLVIVIAAAFIAECLPIHYEFRDNGHAFSLTEIPLVIGLYTAAPLHVVATVVSGTFLARVFVRRSTGVKLFFNTALTLAELTAASAVFAKVSEGASTYEARVWIAAGLGTLAFIVVGEVGMDVLLSIRGEEFSIESFLTSLTFSLTSLGSASIGVLICVTLEVSPHLFPVLLIISLLIGGGAFSYTTLRQRYNTLQLLHNFNSGTSPKVNDVATKAVDQVRTSLRASGADLTIVSGEHIGHTWKSGSAVNVPRPNDWIWQRVVTQREAVLINTNEPDPTLRRYLQSHGLKDLMVVPLIGEKEVLALLSVTDRSGEVGTFANEDLQMLATMGSHVTNALENADLIGKLGEEINERKYQSLHDPLTLLPNRTNFSQQTAAAMDAGASFALGILDVNRFKEINDTLGHDVGDEVLIEVARRLRKADQQNMIAARLGGDEFALLLLGVADETELTNRANAILRAFTNPYRIDGLEVPIDVSLGLALSHVESAVDQKALLKQADVAMYVCKKQRKSSFTIYTVANDVEIDRRIKLQHDLRSVIEHNQLETYFQPKVDLHSGRVVGAEALSRWHHSELGWVEPSEFIDIAEHAGLIGILTSQALRRSVEQIAEWRSQGHELVVALNVSVRTLRDSTLATELTSLLWRHHISGTSLLFQVTEGVADDPIALAAMIEIRRLGVGFAIDNFGTGSIALAKLAELPITELQIDRSIVALSPMRSRPIIAAAVATAKAFGMTTVAEGVETEAQWDLVAELGCDLAQGYLVAPAIAREDFGLWLATDAVRLLRSCESQTPPPQVTI
jgi:diguanylate cyclase (GGDEF)-like protein